MNAIEFSCKMSQGTDCQFAQGVGGGKGKLHAVDKRTAGCGIVINCIGLSLLLLRVIILLLSIVR